MRGMRTLLLLWSVARMSRVVNRLVAAFMPIMLPLRVAIVWLAPLRARASIGGGAVPFSLLRRRADWQPWHEDTSAWSGNGWLLRLHRRGNRLAGCAFVGGARRTFFRLALRAERLLCAC
jgi:hypothetical protein